MAARENTYRCQSCPSVQHSCACARVCRRLDVLERDAGTVLYPFAGDTAQPLRVRPKRERVCLDHKANNIITVLG